MLGLTTYDAKDPDTSSPPIESLLPPEGAPNVLIIFSAMSASAPPHRTVIQQTFPLEQISDAFAALAAGTLGKIVLVIDQA